LAAYWGIPEARITVQPQVVDLNARPTASRLQIKTRYDLPEKFALFVGRVSRMKGVDVLLYALKGTKIDCIVVGNGPELPEMKRLAVALGVRDQVKFLGALDWAEVESLYSAASYLVLPTRAEAFPLVVFEAFAQSLPVVASDIQGLGEIIQDNVNGFLVPVDSPSDLRKAMITLAESTPTRESIGKSARKTVEELSSDVAIAKILTSVYEKALDRKVVQE
jgi:glycosyltransferase involved in cell wall biosynthesis